MRGPAAESRPVAVVAGVGEGLGAPLCRALVARGHTVAALGRAVPATLANEPHIRSFTLNLASREQVDAAFQEISASLGDVEVVVYNAHQLVIRPFGELREADLRRALDSGVVGAFHVAQCALASMKRGTLIFTGATASLRGAARFSAFAAAKFAMRGMAQSLAREYGPRGIHVAHVVIDGLIWCPQTIARFDPEPERCLPPEPIVEAYLQLVDQSPGAWTHELDLRPSTEAF